MKTKLLILFTFFTLCTAAQQRKTLRGVVIMNEAGVAGVYVINNRTGDEVKTDSKGNFSIPARNGDKLAVHSTFTQDREFYISNDSFKDMPYVLSVESKTTQLDAVVISDTVSINHPVQGAKEYTVAERRANIGAVTTVRTMDTINWQGGGVVIPLDPTINGKDNRDAIRRQLETERLLAVVNGIGKIYTDEALTETLGINKEKVEAFKYFAAENPDLAAAVKYDDKDKAQLMLSELAIEYIRLQQSATTNNKPNKNED